MEFFGAEGPGLCPVPGIATVAPGKDLLDVHVHLPQERRVSSEAITLVGENGHSLLRAVGLQDCLGSPKRQAVERSDGNDPIVPLIRGGDTFAYGGDGLSDDGRRDMQFGLPKQAGDVVGAADRSPGGEGVKRAGAAGCVSGGRTPSVGLTARLG